MNILIICLVIVVAIVFCYYLYTKKSKNSQAITEKDVKACLTDLSSLKIESIDRELSFFKDVVSYFKDLHLDSKKDTPFIMSGESFKKMFKDVRVELLVGNGSENKKIKEMLAIGEIDVVIGTHALFSEDVEFKDRKSVV